MYLVPDFGLATAAFLCQLLQETPEFSTKHARCNCSIGAQNRLLNYNRVSLHEDADWKWNFLRVQRFSIILFQKAARIKQRSSFFFLHDMMLFADLS